MKKIKLDWRVVFILVIILWASNPSPNQLVNEKGESIQSITYESIVKSEVKSIPVYFYDVGPVKREILINLTNKVPYRYLEDLGRIQYINSSIYIGDRKLRGAYLHSKKVITLDASKSMETIPSTLCHELAHHVIKDDSENEVSHELIGYLGNSLFCYEGRKEVYYEGNITQRTKGFEAIEELI